MSNSRVFRPAAVAAAAFVLLLALAVVVSGVGNTQASSAGGMEAMSIDLDVAGNTATNLGPRDSCVEARPGDLLTVDVTALNIPQESAMVGFEYWIRYDEMRIPLQSQDHQFLLAANPGSALLSFSDPTPDENLNGEWVAAVADLAAAPPEFGSGVLSRLTIGVSQSTSEGIYSLAIVDADHIDSMNAVYLPDVLNSGEIAVGRSCPPSTATPSPAATASPAPTPTPEPPLVTVTFEPEAQLQLTDSLVTVRGTVSCSEPIMVEVDAAVRQFVKGIALVAASPSIVEVLCDDRTPWSLAVKPDPQDGRFRPGDAEVIVAAGASGTNPFGASGAIRLKPGTVK